MLLQNTIYFQVDSWGIEPQSGMSLPIQSFTAWSVAKSSSHTDNPANTHFTDVVLSCFYICRIDGVLNLFYILLLSKPQV